MESLRKSLEIVLDWYTKSSQPTSTSFMRDMRTLGIEQIFTSYDNPKGNADTEWMIRTIKEEVVWVNEFSSLKLYPFGPQKMSCKMGRSIRS